MAEEIKNPAVEAPEVNLGDILRVRREKLAALREAGADPFQITKYPQDAYSAEIKERFAYLEAEAETEVEVCLAGRMMTKRVMGKASFAHLRDDKGDIQIYVRRDVIGDEAYAGFKKMDIGDIVGAIDYERLKILNQISDIQTVAQKNKSLDDELIKVKNTLAIKTEIYFLLKEHLLQETAI